MTKAQKATLEKMKKKRSIYQIGDLAPKTVGDEVHVTTKDGDDLAILPNGLSVPR